MTQLLRKLATIGAAGVLATTLATGAFAHERHGHEGRGEELFEQGCPPEISIAFVTAIHQADAGFATARTAAFDKFIAAVKVATTDEQRAAAFTIFKQDVKTARQAMKAAKSHARNVFKDTEKACEKDD